MFQKQVLRTLLYHGQQSFTVLRKINQIRHQYIIGMHISDYILFAFFGIKQKIVRILILSISIVIKKNAMEDYFKSVPENIILFYSFTFYDLYFHPPRPEQFSLPENCYCILVPHRSKGFPFFLPSQHHLNAPRGAMFKTTPTTSTSL